MQTRLFPVHVDVNLQVFFKARGQGTPPVGIQQTHSPDVSREVTFPDKVRQHRLKEGRWADVEGESYSEKALNEIWWDYDVPEAQRRKQDLAERSNVYHSRTAIESLQRRNRHALITIFTVVIVFDDPRS